MGEVQYKILGGKETPRSKSGDWTDPASASTWSAQDGLTTAQFAVVGLTSLRKPIPPKELMQGSGARSAPLPQRAFRFLTTSVAAIRTTAWPPQNKALGEGN